MASPGGMLDVGGLIGMMGGGTPQDSGLPSWMQGGGLAALLGGMQGGGDGTASVMGGGQGGSSGAADASKLMQLGQSMQQVPQPNMQQGAGMPGAAKPMPGVEGFMSLFPFLKDASMGIPGISGLLGNKQV